MALSATPAPLHAYINSTVTKTAGYGRCFSPSLSLLPPVYAHSPMVVHGYTRSTRGYFLKKSVAARKLTVNCSLSRQSPLAHCSRISCSPIIWKFVIRMSYRNLLITFPIGNLTTASASFSM